MGQRVRSLLAFPVLLGFLGLLSLGCSNVGFDSVPTASQGSGAQGEPADLPAGDSASDDPTGDSLAGDSTGDSPGDDSPLDDIPADDSPPDDGTPGDLPPSLPPPPPLVEKVGVVTILLALGDQLGSELVVKGSSAQFIAETAVRYASPLPDPKILVVRDANHNGESAYDPQYIAGVLLQRYNAKFIEEPTGGLKAADLVGYDLIWFNNPGYPMGSIQSRDTLMAFQGGVVLSGDDLSQGAGFDLSALTGLSFIDNGVTVVCGGAPYLHNNNEGYKYSVTLDSTKVPEILNTVVNFSYGNDIDNAVASPAVEVIATAVGGLPTCTTPRPVIVRYAK